MATNVPTILSPQGIDAALALVQDRIALKPLWPTKVFGEAELISTGTGRARQKVFAVYAGENAGTEREYVELMPRHDLVGFSFFHVLKQTSENVQTGGIAARVKVLVDFDLVAFWNYKDLYPINDDQYTVRHVEKELTEALVATREPGLMVRVLGAVRPFDEVFKPANLTETDVALMRRPYGCIRINCKLEFVPVELGCPIPQGR